MDLFTFLLTGLLFHLAWCLGGLHTMDSHPRIQYNRELLLQWSTVNVPPSDLRVPNWDEVQLIGRSELPGGPSHRKPRITKRGSRGGVRLRMKKQPLSRIPLPSIILSNAQSLRNKTDELQAQVRYNHEFRDACILALTETWLTDRDPDKDLEMDGFGVPIRLDRDAAATGKSSGGGVCLYVNERWCNTKSVLIREKFCSADLELLSVSLRPPYLPREFPQVFITLVYIHPRANESNACDLIRQKIQRLQLLSPDAPNIILGDLNHCSLSKVLRDFHQCVTCPTRLNKTLDLCYCSVKGAYKSIPLPPLGSSDHNCVHLIPAYRTELKRGIPQLVLLTKVDEACPLVKEDVKNIYKSGYIKETMQEVSAQLGVPVSCVVPVKNYCEELELDLSCDILLLSAVMQMLRFADNYFDEISDQLSNTEVKE